MMNLLRSERLLQGKKKMLLFSVIFLLAVSAGIAQPLAGTFTINANQPTAGTNYQSFNEAAYALSAGVLGPVTFNVAPGTGPYQEQVTFYTIPGSSASKPVVFNCNGVTLQFTSTSSINRAGVKIDSADYITFDSLRVVPLTTGAVNYEYGYGFQLIRDADHNTIKRCTVINTSNLLQPQNVEGIVIVSGDEEANNLGSNQCDSNLIMGNTIIGGNTGITIFNFAGYPPEPFTSIKGNQVINNTIRNTREAGIYLFGTENTLVQGNDIGGSLQSGSTAINVSEMNMQVRVNGNRIHNVSRDPAAASTIDYEGIRVAYSRCIAGKEIVVSNNLIYDIRNEGSQYGLIVENSSFVNFFHNTVVLDTAGSASSVTTVGFSYGASDSSIRFQNNILAITRGGSSGKRGITVSAAGYNFVCDYNDLYINATTGSNIIGTFGGTYTTLTTWQSATGKDYHSYNTNPILTNSASNLKPTNGALDNTGIFVGISTDVDNITRSNTGPDVGAYEFLSSPCSTPPVAGVANAVPGTVLCAGSPVTLTIAGNSGGIGQTYQWQTSATANGTYTNLGTANSTTPLDAVANNTLYYRLQVTCASVTSYTTPIQIKANTPFVAGTYTINKTQPTAGTNFTSFADVLVALRCGTTGPIVFNVAPGTGPYNEQVIIPAVSGSSATNTITFNGNGQTLNYLSTNSAERAVLKLNGASNIIIDSLNITALGSSTSEYGYGIQLLNNADNNVIRKSTITINTTSSSNRYAAITVSSASDAETTSSANLCDNNTFTNNTIIGGYWGAIVSSSTSSLISNNKFTNNTFRDFYGNGISIYGTTGTLIEGNDFSRPTRTASGTTYGVYINSVSTNLKVSKNKIHNFFDNFLTSASTAYGIYATSADATAAANNIYSNNVIYNFNGLGTLYGIGNSSSDYSLYYHNTILIDAASTAATAAQGFYQTTTAVGIQFKNNIVVITRGGTGINRGIYMSTTGLTYTSDNNDYIVASATGTNYTGTIGSTNYATLANWQSGSSKDAASVSINPVFSNAATGNLLPTATTLDNKGSFVNIATDITGATRSTTTPDVGAYEFAAPLPIKLVDLSATKIVTNVLVNWSTATEANSSTFQIERSIDGINFTAAGTIAAHGNSTQLRQYSFTDRDAVSNATTGILYYRIKSVDKDGSYEYTRIVAVRLDGKATVTVSSFPNPFLNDLYVKITATTNEQAAIRILDVTGKTIELQQQKIIVGTNLIQLSGASKLAKGTYIVQVEMGGNQYSTRVVK